MTNEKDAPVGGCRYTPSHIANYFIWFSQHQGVEDLTPMKLIKLVYIGYAWYYYLENKPLFGETIEAWEHGPVIPSLYAEFKEFGKNPITSYATYRGVDSGDKELGEVTYPVIEEDDDEVAPIMAAVFNVYKGETGAQLSKITHRNTGAWQYARDKRADPNSNERIKMDANDPNILAKMKEGAQKGIEKLIQSGMLKKETN